MQTMYATISGRVTQLSLPDPSELVVPGVRWGKFDDLLTPAFWRGQAWQHEQLGIYANLRIGRCLAEEVAVCLLGGFGMIAELGASVSARPTDNESLC